MYIIIFNVQSNNYRIILWKLNAIIVQKKTICIVCLFVDWAGQQHPQAIFSHFSMVWDHPPLEVEVVVVVH